MDNQDRFDRLMEAYCDLIEWNPVASGNKNYSRIFKHYLSKGMGGTGVGSRKIEGGLLGASRKWAKKKGVDLSEPLILQSSGATMASHGKKLK